VKPVRCSRCQRVLTDPFSIAIGMGPECRGKLSKRGWKFPRPKYRVSNGRVVFVGMAGRLEAPAVVEIEKKKKKVEEE